MLLQYAFLVPYPVNPRTLAKFRAAFTPSGAKDDPTDAQLAQELLDKHREKLRPWQPDDEPTRTLQLLVEQRRKLVNDKTRLLNRLTSTLKGYFLQVLTWFQPLDTGLVYAFLQHWPTLETVCKRMACLSAGIHQDPCTGAPRLPVLWQGRFHPLHGPWPAGEQLPHKGQERALRLLAGFMEATLDGRRRHPTR